METVIYKTNTSPISCPIGSCGCVGYAYVPIQQLETTLSPEKALECGSLFPELVLDICEYGTVCKQLGGIE